MLPASVANLEQLLQATEQRILAGVKDLQQEWRSDLLEIKEKLEQTQRMKNIPAMESIPTGTATEPVDKEVSFWETKNPTEVMDRYFPLAVGGSSDVDTGPARELSRPVSEERSCNCLAEFVRSSRFDQLASAIVIANAIFVGVEVDLNCRYRLTLPKDQAYALHISNLVFLELFSVELSLRVWAHGFKFFQLHSDDFYWNWMDTIIVGLQVVEQILAFIVQRAANRTIAIMRVLRVVRLLRILRVLRLLHLFDELGMLLHAMIQSMTGMLWAVLLMLILVYCVSILLAERMWHSLHADVPENLLYFFRDVPRTALTLVESILGGLSWDEAVWPLFTEVGVFCGSGFLFFVFIGFFVLVNVVTGIFNDAVSKSTEAENSNKYARTLQFALGMIDSHGTSVHHNDKISWEKFYDMVKYDEFVKDYFASIQLDPNETSARKVFEILDADRNMELTRGEILEGCLKLREPARAVDVYLMRHNLDKLAKGLEYIMESTNRLVEKT